jgi:hypothetical protein
MVRSQIVILGPTEQTKPVGGLWELASGVDALYLSGKAVLPDSLLGDLEVARSQAEEHEEPVPWSFGGQECLVAPHGFGKWRYCVRHRFGQIGLTPSKHLPALKVQPRAEFLHGYGAAGAIVWFRDFLQSGCGPVRLSVSRLDLHADFQGWDLDGDDRHKFLCRASCLRTFEESESFNGLQFGTRGSGTIVARIYDKTEESAKSGSAYWPEIWGSRHNPDRPVLRVEFQIGRDALRQYGLDAPEEVLAATGSLWISLTKGWLTYRTPTADQTKSRWPLAPEWQQVQRASIGDDSYGIDRTYDGKRRGELENLAPGLVGYLSNVAALTNSETLAESLPHVSRLVRWYGAESGVAFEERIQAKEREYLLS